MRRIIIAIIGGLLLIGGLVAYTNRVAIKDWMELRSKPTLPKEEGYRGPADRRAGGSKNSDVVASDVVTSVRPTSDATIPDEKLLAVPFIPQAPKQIWDAKHEEACEEASMLMIRGYFDGESGAVVSSTAETRIQSLIDFETDLGYGVDVTAAEAVKIIEKRWPDLTAEVVPMTGPDSVKRFIADGLPVILPADGKTLPNPNFRNGGPVYHMLVVRGYTPDQFITNDPGTRKGENFLYTYDGLLNAVHDWNGGDVKNGAPVMIVVHPR
jgi:hypothetical protein